MDTVAATQLVERLIKEAPGQLECVWDNLNLQSKHRFERMIDNSWGITLDWMASLFIKERINVNHMDFDVKKPFKKLDELSIADFITSSEVRFHYRLEKIQTLFWSLLI